MWLKVYHLSLKSLITFPKKINQEIIVVLPNNLDITYGIYW